MLVEINSASLTSIKKRDRRRRQKFCKLNFSFFANSDTCCLKFASASFDSKGGYKCVD